MPDAGPPHTPPPSRPRPEPLDDPPDHVLALDQVHAPQPFVRQVAVVRVLPHRDHDRRRAEQALEHARAWHRAALPHRQRLAAPLRLDRHRCIPEARAVRRRAPALPAAPDRHAERVGGAQLAELVVHVAREVADQLLRALVRHVADADVALHSTAQVAL